MILEFKNYTELPPEYKDYLSKNLSPLLPPLLLLAKEHIKVILMTGVTREPAGVLFYEEILEGLRIVGIQAFRKGEGIGDKLLRTLFNHQGPYFATVSVRNPHLSWWLKRGFDVVGYFDLPGVNRKHDYLVLWRP